jgi:hypothetical protein
MTGTGHPEDPAGARRGASTATAVTDRRPVRDAFVLAVPSALGLWFVALAAHSLLTAGPGRTAQLAPYLLLGGLQTTYCPSRMIGSRDPSG